MPAIAIPAAPASEASSPVAASSPAASDPVAPTPASAPVVASQPATTPVIKIAVFGDDEMSGIAISNWMPTLVTPNQESNLQSALQNSFNDLGISVTNYATGGTASSLQNELDGMDGGGAAEPQRMQGTGASIVIQEHMLNDALGGETVDEYSAYLAQWVHDAQSAGLTPVLEEASPVCDDNHPQLSAYVDAMNVVARRMNVPVIHQYSYVQGIAGWQSHMIGCLYPDATLLAVKAQQELAVIAPMVKAQMGD